MVATPNPPAESPAIFTPTYEIQDKTGIKITFIVSRINRLELQNTALRVALNNEIIKFSFDTPEEAEKIYKDLTQVIETTPSEFMTSNDLTHTIKSHYHALQR